MNLSIAIPDSTLQDESTLLHKTKKVSIIARSCAIFKVNQIFIYKDKGENKNDYYRLEPKVLNADPEMDNASKENMKLLKEDALGYLSEKETDDKLDKIVRKLIEYGKEE